MNCMTGKRFTKVLKDLLSRSENQNDDEEGFASNWRPPHNLIDPNQRQHTLKLWRKKMFSLLHAVGENKNPFDKKMFICYRNDIDELFSLLISSRKYLQMLDITMFIEEIKHLIESIGTLSNLVDMSNESVENQHGVLISVIHLYLESYCQYLHFLHLVCQDNEDVKKEMQLFISSLISDLIDVSFQCYNLQSRKDDVFTRQLFPCSCFEEFWCIIIVVADNLSNLFWTLFSEQLTKALDNGEGNELLKFQTCLLVKIAPIYWISNNSGQQVKEKTFIPANWVYFQEILKKACSSENEDTVKAFLIGASTLLDHWNVNNDILNIFWDYFSKQMNRQWGLTNYRNFKTFTKLENTLEKKSEAFSAIIQSGNEESHTLFDWFLKFLHKSMKRAQNLSNEQYIATAKRKIFSKFHKRQMEEINVHGLNNFTSLFTMVTMTTNNIDIAKKMTSLLSLIPTQNSSPDFKKSYVISYFVILLICRQKQLSADFIIEKILSILNDITKVLKTKISNKRDTENEQMKWEIATLCLNSFEYCFTYDTFSSNEGLYLSFNYTKFLEKALSYPVYISMLVRHIERILLHILDHEENSIDEEIYEKLFINIYEPLKNVLQKDINNHADVLRCIAWFAMVTIDWKTSKISFGILLKNYAFSPTFTCDQRCSFINHLLGATKSISYIESNDVTIKIMSVWLELVCIHTDKQNTFLKEFTQNLQMLKFCKCYMDIPRSVQDIAIENVAVNMISAIGSNFYRAKDIFEMKTKRDNITMLFKDLIKTCERTLLTKPLNEIIVSRLVRFSGNLVRYCPKAIYKKTEPTCMLPQLLDIFVLPLPSRPLKENVINIVKENLHLFLLGIASLEFKKDEFLGRKLRKIHSEYFKYFVIESHNNLSLCNPFMVALKSCFHVHVDGAQVKSEYKQFIMEIIMQQMIECQQDPQPLISILHFLSDALKFSWTKDDFVTVLEDLMFNTMTFLILCERLKQKGETEPPDMRKYIMDIFQQISQKCQNNEVISKTICRFIKTNIPKREGCDEYASNKVATIQRALKYKNLALVTYMFDMQGAGEDEHRN